MSRYAKPTAKIAGWLLVVIATIAVASADTPVPTTIGSNTTLKAADGPFVLQGDTAVNARVTLTIEAGAVVKVPAHARLIVSGKLVAPGTAARRVQFLRSTSASWGGLEFRADTSSGSDLRYCLIDHAGAAPAAAAVVVAGGTSNYPAPSLTRCEIIASASEGLLSSLGKPHLDACTISGSKGTAILVKFGGMVDFVSPCLSPPQANHSDTVTFDAAGNGLLFAQRWKLAGFPYRLLGTVVTAQTGATLALDPGLELRMGSGVFLEAFEAPILAQGTAAKPIVMRSASTARWSGLYVAGVSALGPGGGSESAFTYCNVSGGGSGGAASLVGYTAHLTVTNCTFTNGAGSGVYLWDSNAVIRGTAITGHRQSGLVANGTSQVTFSGGRVESNTLNGVFLAGTSTAKLTPNNTLRRNGNYDVVNQTPNTISARKNYWGTTSKATIAKHIFDFHDVPSFGVVQFSPFLTSAAASAALASTERLTITSAAALPVRSGGVQVTYVLSAPAQVQARVLNMAGRPVRTLVGRQEAEAGTNLLLWDGRGDGGTLAPAGAYFIELRAQTDDGAQARLLTSTRVAR